MTDERVYTVIDYYDGPRQGSADFEGRPHAYHCIRDSRGYDWTDHFRLKLLTQEQFEAVLVDWQIWLRWRKAFDSGLATIASHPALPEDTAEHDRLKDVVSAAYHVPEDARVAHGTFDMDVTRGELVVRWQGVDDPSRSS